MNGFVRFMKRNYKVIIIVAAISVALWSFIPREKATDPEKDKMLLELLTFVIEKGIITLHLLMILFQKVFTKII
jgi:carboxyl-terminal processing protease